MIGEARSGDRLIFSVPPQVPQMMYLGAPLGDAALCEVPGFGREGRRGAGPAGTPRSARESSLKAR